MFASQGTQFLAIGDAKLVKAWSIDHGPLAEGRIANGEHFSSSMIERC